RRPSIRAGPTTGQSLFTVFAQRQICGSLSGSPPISRSVPFRVTRWRYGGPHQVDALVNTYPISGHVIPPLPLLNSHHSAPSSHRNCLPLSPLLLHIPGDRPRACRHFILLQVTPQRHQQLAGQSHNADPPLSTVASAKTFLEPLAQGA